MTAVVELMAELNDQLAAGRRLDYVDLVRAIAHLEPRQAEAMCQVLWALPLRLVVQLANEGDLATLQRREGYSHRKAGKQLGISQKNVGELVERSKKNILAWLLTPEVG